METAGAALLDENTPFSVELLDSIVAAAYEPRHPERAVANARFCGV